MQEETNINIMGSDVEDGFVCKPKKLDPNKPIMHYKNIIYICVDKRCQALQPKKYIDTLREMLKQLELHKGKDRIKISKALCFGACRYKSVANIFENNPDSKPTNNNIWLKQTHLYSLEKWTKLFLSLKENKALDEFDQIKMKIYE